MTAVFIVYFNVIAYDYKLKNIIKLNDANFSKGIV